MKRQSGQSPCPMILLKCTEAGDGARKFYVQRFSVCTIIRRRYQYAIYGKQWEKSKEKLKHNSKNVVKERNKKSEKGKNKFLLVLAYGK